MDRAPGPAAGGESGAGPMSAGAIAASPARLPATLSAIRAGIRVHAMLYAFALFVCTAAVVESLWLGLPLDLEMVLIFSGPVLLLLLLMMAIGLTVEAIRLARSGYGGSALAALGAKLRDDYLAPQRIANALHAFAFMSLYMAGYTFIKRAIPLAVPFAWDETFMDWDKAVHFGRHPYELLAPLLNFSPLTFALNVNYNLWFLVMFSCWFWRDLPADSALRLRFLLGFTLTGFSAPAFSARSSPRWGRASAAACCRPRSLSAADGWLHNPRGHMGSGRCRSWTHCGRIMRRAKAPSTAYRRCRPCMSALRCCSPCSASLPASAGWAGFFRSSRR
jgi:hypothetical protein